MESKGQKPVPFPMADDGPEISQLPPKPATAEGGRETIDAFINESEMLKGTSAAPKTTEEIYPEETQYTARGAQATVEDKMVDQKPSAGKTDKFNAPASAATAKGDDEVVKSGRPKEPQAERIPFFKLFSRSTGCQKAQVGLGIFSAMVAGAVAPSIAIIFGEIVAIFDPNNDAQTIEDAVIKLIKLIAILSAIQWVFGYLQYAFLQGAAERVSFDLRTEYLSALLRQETEFFEKRQVEALPSQISEYFQVISEGVGEKVGQLVYAVSMFIGGLCIAFWYGPVFTLICLCYIPLMIGIIAVFGGVVRKKMIQKMAQTKKLGAHTEEILSAFKLVVAFAQEDLAVSQYDKIAQETKDLAKSATVFQSIVHGSFLGAMFGFFCYSYAIGGFLISAGKINPSTGEIYSVVEIISVTQATMMASMTFASVFPIVPAIIKALIAGHEVFEVIERTPEIRSPDTPSEFSAKIDIASGIRFQNVQFKYPTAPEGSRPVFEGVNFAIEPYTSTAIVGPSGSGKSTIVQLLNRFYDPANGSIFIGDENLKTKDLTALRGTIGYVSQEPVLILGTIRDNMIFGNRDATQKDIDEALARADATFVNDLENKIDTYVGSGSVLNLSGGQKQRIAIARALIKKPKILVLDEATSALDPKSEAEVQAAIVKIQEEAGSKITTIMIAHRLQTIKTAQNLLYIEDSKSVIAAKKGTPEYDDIIQRLEKTNYAHQNNELEDADDEQVQRKKTMMSSTKRSLSLRDTAKTTNVDGDSSAQQKSMAGSSAGQSSGRGQGWGRVFSYYEPKSYAFLMIFLAAVNSLAFPLLGFIIAKLQFTFMRSQTDPTWEEDHAFYIYLFIGLCVVLGVVGGSEKGLFGVTGENLSFNVRKDLLKGILFKQVQWFDREDRAPGILTNVLSEDISALNGMTTETISVMVESFLSLMLGLLIAMFISWRMALLTVACSPVMIIGVVAMSRLQWGNKRGKQKDSTQQVDAYEKSNALLSDVIINYRTVIGLGQKNVDEVVNRFTQLLVEPSRRKVKNAHLGGLFFGYSNCARMIFMGIVFYIGSVLVKEYQDKSDDIYLSVWILFSTCMGAGIALSNMPSVQKAKHSAQNIFGIIDETSTLDVRMTSGKGIKTIESGKIEFKDVTFSYPSREAKVLNKFVMEIPATQKIALVGHSGCGKSTITNLLLRFYNIQSGMIEIDGVDLKDYDVKSLRRQIGYVMQEPVLFNQTIKQNILYGDLDASDEQVLKVAQMANALTFIESNVEDLDKDQRLAQNEQDLREEIEKLPQATKTVILGAGKLSETQISLFLQVLRNIDRIALDFINEEPETFINELKENSQQAGMKWDDLVFNFEWQFEYKKILASDSFDAETKADVKETAFDFKYLFNTTMVQEWAASKQVTFAEYVQAHHQTYVDACMRRFETLQESMLDKMRDENGKIKLSQGFEKNCGLKGQKLSGGQKQRIAIARAIIKDPKILILDEATSALDEQSQEIVQQALDRAMEGRTSIVIAHRLSTIRNCDVLFVLNKGQIVEQGTYDELSADKESFFFKLKSGMEM